MSSPVPDREPEPEGARALLAGGQCPGCGAPLSGRQQRACSPRCRAPLSRRRRATALAARIAELQTMVRALGGAPEGPPLPAPTAPRVWRFRVEPAGRRFGWQGRVYGSERETGLLEVGDADFAAALRRLAVRDSVEELA